MSMNNWHSQLILDMLCGEYFVYGVRVLVLFIGYFDTLLVA